ncbi:MAG: cupin-like domain-containing protein, partial [Sphingomicrobium sp.]
MPEVTRRTREIDGLDPERIPFAELLESQQPAILKGVVKGWEIARRGAQSAAAAIDYLVSFDGGRPVVGYTGAPEIGGRFFYNPDMTGLNFEARRVPLTEFMRLLEAHLNDNDPASFYIGSTDLDLFLPGIREENRLPLNDPMFDDNPPTVSIWIGNRTIATAHFDFSNNIACTLVGRRRFTLFPPDRVANLYPGPFQPTPGGQVVSMVDFRDPDFDRYPCFRDALAAGEVAELEPGDALFYPAMWWHHVEALDPFNVMINYWWNTSPEFIDTPMTTLLHGILSLRDRPDQEKQAWRELFDYYVFGDPGAAAEHLPEHVCGILAPLDDAAARRLRAELL